MDKQFFLMNVDPISSVESSKKGAGDFQIIVQVSHF